MHISQGFIQLLELSDIILFEYLFNLTLFLCSFCDSNDMNVRLFAIVPPVSDDLFIFLSVFSLLFRFVWFILFYIEAHLSSVLFILLLILSIEFYILVIVYFVFKISFWFLFTSFFFVKTFYIFWDLLFFHLFLVWPIKILFMMTALIFLPDIPKICVISVLV